MREPRAAVMRFAEHMERKLEANDGIKHDWRREPNGYLLHRLRGEVEELTNALIDGNSCDVVSEAADVANIAMMLADKRLPSTGQRGRALAGEEEP